VHTEQIQALLQAVRDGASDQFSGIGIIVCNTPNSLPITPLRQESQLMTQLPTVEVLLKISDKNSSFHDGFHVLSSDLRIQLLSQYFSPPITTLPLPRDRAIGGRYAAALFGSTLTDVIATGIVSTSYGIAIFVAGTEIFRNT
jgi:hypothetical protein